MAALLAQALLHWNDHRATVQPLSTDCTHNRLADNCNQLKKPHDLEKKAFSAAQMNPNHGFSWTRRTGMKEPEGTTIPRDNNAVRVPTCAQYC